MDAAQLAGAILNRNRHALAVMITDRVVYGGNQELLERYSLGHEEIFEYAKHDLAKIFVALISDRPSLFAKYVEWQRSVFMHRDVPAVVIRWQMTILEEVIADLIGAELGADGLGQIRRILEAGYAQLDLVVSEDASFLDPQAPHAGVARSYLASMLAGRAEEAIDGVIRLAEDGLDLPEIFLDIIEPTQREIGRLWQLNTIDVVDEHYASEGSQRLMAQLRERYSPRDRRDVTVLTACPGGELHDIGARMVSDLLHLNGYDSYFTGANTPHARILDAIERHNVGLVAISATMALQVRLAIDLIDQIHDRYGSRIGVMVGGYAFNQHEALWRDVGADGWAPGAAAAVEIAGELAR